MYSRKLVLVPYARKSVEIFEVGNAGNLYMGYKILKLKSKFYVIIFKPDSHF